jgi:hypothetical protein
MTALSCQHCRAQTVGVVLCKRCQSTASVALQNIAAYHGDLFGAGHEVARIKRRSGSADPTGNAIAANPDHETAAETAAVEATNMLTGWVRILIDDRPGLAWPANTVPAMTDFLREQLRTIAVLEWAEPMLRDLLTFERRLERIVAGSAGQWNAGVCGARTGEGPDDWCAQELVVRPGVRHPRCPSCGTPWSVEARRKQVIEQARDMLLPVSLIARTAVTLLPGEPSQQRLEARLRKWVERGSLDDYGVRVLDGRPRRVYRVGDVIDRLVRDSSGFVT